MINKSNNRKSMYSSQKLIVDALQKDGAICDFVRKEYDEQATFEGGTGNRKAFTCYNNMILRYHKILKGLTGESRANITETIPAIDFLHPENTNLLYTYDFKNGSNFKVDPTSILPLPMPSDKSTLEIIQEELPGIINRALIPGNLMATHFYNTTSSYGSVTDILTSPFKGDKALRYKGVLTRPIRDAEGNEHTSLKTPSIFCYKATKKEPINILIEAGLTNSSEFLKEAIDLTNLEKSNTVNEMPFVTKSILSNDTYNVSLLADDIIIVLPAVSYSKDPSLIIIFKKDDSIKVNPKYKLFACTFTDYIPGDSFIEIPVNSCMPSFLMDEDFFIDSLKNYLDIQLEYYSDASGLLCGYYSKPLNEEKSMMGNSVHKWIFDTDTEEAKKRGIIIDKGSKYFSGHILNRGKFIEEPLKLTSKDYENVPDGFKVVYDANDPIALKNNKGEFIKGKATLIFDQLDNRISSLFDKIKRPEWVNPYLGKPVYRIGCITRKQDYSVDELNQAEQLILMGDIADNKKEQMIYPNKLKSYQVKKGKPISFKEFHQYFNAAVDLCGNQDPHGPIPDTLYLKLDDKKVNYTINEAKNTTVTFGSWFQNRNKIKSTGNLIYEDFDSMFYVDFTRLYEKHYNFLFKKYYKIVSDMDSDSLTVKMISPLETFAKTTFISNKYNNEDEDESFNCSPDTILVYPEYNNKIPEELYLISKFDLGLREYGATWTEEITDDNGKTHIEDAYERGGMVSFYDDSNEKIIAFKVSKKLTFKPSAIKNITICDPYLKEEDKKILGGDTFTVPCTIEDAEQKDCFIYILNFMDLSLDSLTFYDENNELKSLSEGLDDLMIAPLSYPKDFFESTVIRNPSDPTDIILKVNKESLGSLNNLKGAVIIPDLPNFSSPASLDNFYVGSNSNPISLSIWRELIEKGIYSLANKIIKEGMYNILSNWKITDDTLNPIRMKDMPVVTQGLLDLKEPLSNLDSANFKIIKSIKENEYEKDSNGNLKIDPLSKLPIVKSSKYVNKLEPLSDKDIIGLMQRIDRLDKDISYKYRLYLKNSSGNLIEIEPSISDTSIIDNCFLKPTTIVEQVEIRKNIENIEDSVTGEITQKVTPEYKSAVNIDLNQLPTLIENNIKNIIKINRNIIGSQERPSIYTVGEALKEVLEENGNISRKSCERLDSYFGNGSHPLIKFGNPLLKEPSNIPESLSNLNDELSQIINRCIIYEDDIMKNYKDDFNKLKYQHFFEAAKEIPAVKEAYNDAINSWNLENEPKLFDLKLRTTSLADNCVTDDGHINVYSNEVSAFIRQAIYSNKQKLGIWLPLSRQKFIEKEYYIGRDFPERYKSLAAWNRAWFTWIRKRNHNILENEIWKFINDFKKAKYDEYKEAKQIILNNNPKPNLEEYVKLYLENKLNPSTDGKEDSNIPGLIRPLKEPVKLARITAQQVDEYLKTNLVGTVKFNDLIDKSSTNPGLVATYSINFKLPIINNTSITGEENIATIVPSDKILYIDDNSDSNIIKKDEWKVQIDSPDVSLNVLNGIADFVHTNLEGTDPNNNAPYYVSKTEKDKKVKGRPNSLYYKRYNALNARMNRLNGTLLNVSRFSEGINISKKLNDLHDNKSNGYKDVIEAIPVELMAPVDYMPAQLATGSTIPLPGKFYSREEMAFLKSQIGNKCILTCTRCSVKNSCPFYNEQEILKLYCTPIETIDLWFKDNTLDLLEYDYSIEDRSPNLVYTAPDGSKENLPLEDFKNIHKSFSDILKKESLSESQHIIEEYSLRDLESLRDTLKNSKEVSEDYLTGRDSLGWLLGGRYGTVEKNLAGDLLERNAENTLDLPKYKFLYDALFIPDEESYIYYTKSSTKYNVNVTLGSRENKKTFEGSTYIKIPTSLDILMRSDASDEVYLVSDDTKDSLGNEISPVIYLGQVGNLNYVFDLRDTGNQNECLSSENTGNIYAKDVAQACVNMIKGPMIDDPIGSHLDTNEDRDQYWMKTTKKAIYKNGKKYWLDIPGRSRMSASYQEPVADPDNLDEALVLSGKPVIVNYINFIRKFSIRIYKPNLESPGDGTWLIPWVSPRVCRPDDPNYEKLCEQKRKILPLMKTNLRFVVVKAK